MADRVDGKGMHGFRERMKPKVPKEAYLGSDQCSKKEAEGFRTQKAEGSKGPDDGSGAIAQMVGGNH